MSTTDTSPTANTWSRNTPLEPPLFVSRGEKQFPPSSSRLPPRPPRPPRPPLPPRPSSFFEQPPPSCSSPPCRRRRRWSPLRDKAQSIIVFVFPEGKSAQMSKKRSDDENETNDVNDDARERETRRDTQTSPRPRCPSRRRRRFHHRRHHRKEACLYSEKIGKIPSLKKSAFYARERE